MRCLKRYIAREVYNTLRADLTDLSATATPKDHHHFLRQPCLLVPGPAVNLPDLMVSGQMVPVGGVRGRVGGMGGCVRGRPGLLRCSTRVGFGSAT
jgi:hypothetical protein